MTVLGIDTSTAQCAVALVSDGALIASMTAGAPQVHAEKLLSIIDACFIEASEAGAADAAHRRPDAVAVASGPGSFTGLRIGFSTAKGFCFARGSALVAVPTFDAWAMTASKEPRFLQAGSMLAVIRAGREEAYAATFRRAGGVMAAEASPAVFPTAALAGLAAALGEPVILTDDATRAASWFPSVPATRIVSVAGVNPAVGVALLGETLFRAGSVADLRFAEPAYIKEFSYTLKKEQGA